MNVHISPLSDLVEGLRIRDEHFNHHAFVSRAAMELSQCTDLLLCARKITSLALSELGEACALDSFAESKEWQRLASSCSTDFNLALIPNIPVNADVVDIFAELPVDEIQTSIAPHNRIVAFRIARSLGGASRFALTFAFQRNLTTQEIKRCAEIARDFTDVAAQALLNSATLSQIQQEVRDRDILLSVASHDLKTPLTVLRLHLNLLERTNAAAAQSLGPLFRSVDLLDHSIDSLFTFTQVKSGQVVLKKMSCDVEKIVQSVAQSMEIIVNKAGCELKLSTCQVTAFLDPNSIERILVNLINNSTKYARGKAIHVSLEDTGDTFILRVRDFGPGIPQEERDRIFDSFHRLEKHRSLKGLGLGLYIVRGIVQAHDGKIQVNEPEDGLGGVVFAIHIPSLNQLTEV